MAHTKVPPPLSGQDKFSFAYKTIKDRLPVIIVKTIDFLHRQRKELHKYLESCDNPNEVLLSEIEIDAKLFISELTKLRKDLETNKSTVPIDRIQLDPNLDFFNDDVDLWNKALDSAKHEDDALPRWFDAPWLLIECYLYRKIKEAALKTTHLKRLDPFVEQKHIACRSSLPQMQAIANHLCSVEQAICQTSKLTHPSERSEFGLFIQLALWANKSDLSLGMANADKLQHMKRLSSLRESVESLQENILCDNSSEIWFKVQSIKDKVRSGQQDELYVDLVADNSGYELFVDLCLIYFLSLMFSGPQASKIIKFRIHLKRMPWYVSDAMRSDVKWLINFMLDSRQDASISALANRWKYLIDNGFWEIHDHKFWTLPHDYAEMANVSDDLHSLLAKSSLIIFKGDLNYRKLVGDRKWHVLTPFKVALRDFSPAPLVSLRTAKADVIVGIEDINIFAKINNNELPRDWMISGDFGLIQFLDSN